MTKVCSLVLAAGLLLAPVAVSAQRVAFQGDLPRVMVFLQEDGATAATAMTGFLKEAGFEVVDPAFAKTVAQRERARLALAGDEAEATGLGRDLGAQVIILGAAPTDAAPAPADASLQVGTAQLNVRALRLDQPKVIATGSSSGKALDATSLAARVGALRRASEQLLYKSSFLGSIANDWGQRPWSDAAYWQPERASLPSQLASRTAEGVGEAVRIAILDSDVYPGAPPEPGTRGIGIGKRAKGASAEHARVRGIVLSPSAQVRLGEQPASVRALDGAEQKRYGLSGPGVLFEAAIPLASGQDTVRVHAQAGRGSGEALVRPKIGKRWAVVIGVSDYADKRIQALQFADDDARAMHAFLRSPAGGAIPESQIRLLVNERATAAAIRDALFVFLQQASEEDHVLVYVAAHGAPDPKRQANLYILPHDTNLDAVAATAFPMWDFKTAVRRQIASERVVVIADACHSAGALIDDANPISGAFADLFSPSRRVTLSASGKNELSREGKEWGGGHGVFTHTLLEGLGGKADADEDGVVTFVEAASYVERSVPTLTAGKQNPKRMGLGDVPLAYVGTPAGTK